MLLYTPYEYKDRYLEEMKPKAVDAVGAVLSKMTPCYN
jgi:hypothetical protein